MLFAGHDDLVLIAWLSDVLSYQKKSNIILTGQDMTTDNAMFGVPTGYLS